MSSHAGEGRATGLEGRMCQSGPVGECPSLSAIERKKWKGATNTLFDTRLHVGGEKKEGRRKNDRFPSFDEN